jgi:hypothetical protein
MSISAERIKELQSKGFIGPVMQLEELERREGPLPAHKKVELELRQKILDQERELQTFVRTGPTPIVCRGNQNYSVGTQRIVVDENEDLVLQAFFKDATEQPTWIPLSQGVLRQRSRLEHAPRILKTMRTKYPALASSIDCPGKKGQGGLKIWAQK